ncbi:MAG: T9SS type A sorting domain-containing protein [Bacteroidales bacterium]|nr:T9SS type A sorting domain-containing protein [Bacteroidales bacterium]
MQKKFFVTFWIMLLCGCLPAVAQYQLENPDFERWDAASISLPEHWHSYNTARCNIIGLPSSYSQSVCGVITTTSVHSRESGGRPGGQGSSYIRMRTRRVYGGGSTFIVSGMVSNGMFNVGSMAVYTPQNYFSTERQLSKYNQALSGTPDSLYLWVRYYATDRDSSRARIVAYVHGDTDFQYMNHANNPALYTAYINHLLSRTDSVLPATHWMQLRLPFVYDGKAAPKYILIYMASDSSVLDGHVGNELSIDEIRLVYSSWLQSIHVDGLPVEGFRKDRFSYTVELPYGTSPQYQPKVSCKGEVADITTSVRYVPSAQGVDGGYSEITAKAEDGQSVHTYVVHYVVEKSPEARLASLSYDQTPVPGFHPDTLDYEVALPSGSTVPPIVSCVSLYPGLTPQVTQAVSLPGTARVTVTAANGKTRLTYTVRFRVAISTDASASSIRYNGTLLPGFRPDSLFYAVELPYGTDSVRLDVTANRPKAQLRYPRVFRVPDTAVVMVLAEDTTIRREYRIAFTLAKNNNARLSSLAYRLHGTETAVPAFQAQQTLYVVELPEKTRVFPQLVAQPQDTHALVRIPVMGQWGDTLRVWVVAENGQDSLCYRLFFRVRKARDARLVSIRLDNKPLASFVDTVYSYSLWLDSARVPGIQAEPYDTDATVRVTLPGSVPGMALVEVWAEDTTVHASYRLYFSLRLSDNADLSSLGYHLAQRYASVPSFHKDSLFYRVQLPPLTRIPPVLEWSRADFDATDSVRQPISPNDTAVVWVFSESRVHVKRYVVCFTVALSRDAEADSICCDGKMLEDFHKDSTFYSVWLHYDSLRPPVVTARASSPVAQVRVRQALALGDTAEIRIQAEDTSVVKVYRLLFRRTLSPVASLHALQYRLGTADSLLPMKEGQTVYTLPLREKTTEVPDSLRCLPQDARATVRILRTPVKVNDTALVRVLAENGLHAADYLFAFRRTLSSDVALDSLWIEDTLVPAFQVGERERYFVLTDSVVAMPEVRAHAAWEGSLLHITPLAAIPGTAQIRVIAEDSVHYAVYTLHFRYLHRDARLQALYLDGGFPLPQFRPEVFDYTLFYGPWFPNDVRAETMDSLSSYRWDSETRQDTMDIRVEVTAEDTSVRCLYRVRVLLRNAVPEWQAETFALYPNPAHTVLYVKGVKGERVRLFDMSGRMVLQAEPTGEATLQVDISGLARGMYVVRCGKEVRKVVKE